MAAAESISVPSQSNTIRSKRSAMALLRCAQPIDEALQLLRQRRLDGQGLARQRVGELQLRRMQEHALQPLAFEPLVEREVTVLGVTAQREAQMRQMHADLVSAAGFELDLEQA